MEGLRLAISSQNLMELLFTLLHKYYIYLQSLSMSMCQFAHVWLDLSVLDEDVRLCTLFAT